MASFTPIKSASRSPAHRSRRTWLWAMLGFTTVVGGVAGAMMAILLPQQIMPGAINENEFRFEQIQSAELDYALHILILGTDTFDATRPQTANADGEIPGRSDTIMLARFDPTENTVALLSIPRDTRILLPGYGHTKINATHSAGGPVLTARIISQLLGGIPIDRYVRIDTDGIEALIDAIGGVEIYVPERMQYTDQTQKLFIDLEPGLQRLTGAQAHQFIRFRQDELGDIGRVQRQQELLRALSREMLNPSTWTRAPKILDAVYTHLETNLRWEELLSLARFALQADQEHFDMIMLPGRFSQASEYPVSYWLPDPEATYQVAVNFFNAPLLQGEIESRPISALQVAVQNASGTPGMATRLVQDLQQKGFVNIYAIEDLPQVLEKTQIIAQQGDIQAAETVQTFLGVGTATVESTGSLQSDVTIKVGQDWVNYWYPEALGHVDQRFDPSS